MPLKLLLQTTAASLSWSTYVPDILEWEQFQRYSSLPLHFTFDNQTGPWPSPKMLEPYLRAIRAPSYPSCRHTTFAFFMSQPLPWIEPHSDPYNTSTRPTENSLLPLSLSFGSTTQITRRKGTSTLKWKEHLSYHLSRTHDPLRPQGSIQ